jgi:hypothetical protein
MRSQATSGAHREVDVTLPPNRFVVVLGVRHVPIDLLPRDIVTFRVICGQDVVPDEHPSADPLDCTWCCRVDRAWLLVKATDVI